VKAQAQPRTIGGQTYSDAIAYVVAGGHDTKRAQMVINAYKRYYSQKQKGAWQAYVVKETGVDEVTATAIMRRYRNFYGK
jgi:hypothetical protein